MGFDIRGGLEAIATFVAGGLLVLCVLVSVGWLLRQRF